MRLTQRLALALLLSVAANPLFALSIENARLLPLGTIVTVEGGVTTYSGSYATSTFDQGFAIEDHTAGIYVSTADNPILEVGQKVRVTGALADDGFGQLVIKPASLADVDLLFGIRLVHPERTRTGDVGEGTEGLLVRVHGAITRITGDLPYGYKVYIDDGSGEIQIFMSASTAINPYRIPFIEVGEEIEVVGLSSQFLAEYEVMPRFRTDVRRDH